MLAFAGSLGSGAGSSRIPAKSDPAKYIFKYDLLLTMKKHFECYADVLINNLGVRFISLLRGNITGLLRGSLIINYGVTFMLLRRVTVWCFMLLHIMIFQGAGYALCTAVAS